MENIPQTELTSSSLASLINGELQGRGDLLITGLLTDSRQLSYSEGLGFFAIRGQNHDGHRFIPQLHERGIRIFVVEDFPGESEKYKECCFIKVRNTIEALQSAAAWKRKNFSGTVIAVTGSTGKTVVKEWLADITGSERAVIRSPKSYNSQVGVPLSVWKLDETYSVGIFEAGISRPGEMIKLERIIAPDVGIITNIGEAHSENFSNLKAKALEKLQLFKNCPVIIYCRDYKVIHEIIIKGKDFSGKRLVDWSFTSREACYFIRKTELPGGRTGLTITGENHENQFEIPFSDRASIENAAIVAVTGLSTGIAAGTIGKGLSGLTPVAMRMEIKKGINGCLLIEDYYNSDPGSLGMALEYLVSQNGRMKSLILSDFIQSGRNEKELYTQVASQVSKMGIERFIGIGDSIFRYISSFPAGSRFYHTTEDFLQHYPFQEFRNEIILLKGARIFEFERIGQVLEQQVHQTLLEINLDAISHNLNIYRQYLKKGTRIMAMVKAFAYGAGPSEIATLLEYHRIDYLAVAYADEGVGLRQAGVTLPVVVMNPEVSAFGVMIKYNLEPEIYSRELLRQFSETASSYGLVQYPIHIKIDTGMHRLGFLPGETDSMISELKSGLLRVVSVFSHLAASEDPLYDQFTRHQAAVFLDVTEKIKQSTGYGFLRHLLNSAGIVRFPEYQFEMVRPGIGLYGINSAGNQDLRPAGRYVTRISQVKSVPGGDPVGYGCADVSDQERSIAILPVGYADGLDRKLGNRNGSLFIAGKEVPIIGNICMDMCMADVTGLDVKSGDEAEIFGRNISVEKVAKRCGTIPYEILTSVPPRVKRVFFRE